MYQKLEQKVILSGLSSATLKSYGRSIAHITLFFNQIPLELSDQVINEYLAEIRSSRNPSETYFKHAVYGLRYLFRLFGREDRAIALPQIARSNKLPVILNRKEVFELLSTPKLLKHRVLLGLTYAAGLRLFEVAALRISNLDFERKTIFVEQDEQTLFVNRLRMGWLAKVDIFQLMKTSFAVYKPTLVRLVPNIFYSTDNAKVNRCPNEVSSLFSNKVYAILPFTKTFRCRPYGTVMPLIF